MAAEKEREIALAAKARRDARRAERKAALIAVTKQRKAALAAEKEREAALTAKARREASKAERNAEKEEKSAAKQQKAKGLIARFTQHKNK